MTKLLQTVTTDGTAASLISLNSICEVAGKTGTTQYNGDRYFVGYTPTILAGVWQGYASPRSLDFIGGNYSAIIWDNVISSITSKIPAYSRRLSFEVPQHVQALTYDEQSGQMYSQISPTAKGKIGWFDTKRLKE